jgi:hypothetical protein
MRLRNLEFETLPKGQEALLNTQRLLARFLAPFFYPKNVEELNHCRNSQCQRKFIEQSLENPRNVLKYEAEETDQRVLTERRGILRKENVDTLTSVGILPYGSQDHGKYEQGASMRRWTLDERAEKLPEPEHPNVLSGSKKFNELDCNIEQPAANGYKKTCAGFYTFCASHSK